MSDVPFTSDRQLARQTNRALRLKEWLEQRWRFALGTVVLSTLLGGMLRAQIIPFHEAAILVYWPIGTILTVFLAMGPIATEKTARTWDFLQAQPIPRRRILLAKWRMGLNQLMGMMLISGLVGLAAMWSRGFYGRVSIWELTNGDERSSIAGWLDMAAGHPALWLALLVLVATVTLACWYTFLFVMLQRARNEFAAALAGLLLTITAHVWLMHLVARRLFTDTGELVRVIAGLNPFTEFLILTNPTYLRWLVPAASIHITLWMGIPLLFMMKRR